MALIPHFDPAKVTPVDCPCWRLTRPLADEALPDHACFPTMCASVEAWRQGMWDDLKGWFDDYALFSADRGTPSELPDPDARSRSLAASIDLSHLLDAAVRLARGRVVGWPLRFKKRLLILVLRQWVQEGPSRTLAALLADHPLWRREVQGLRGVYELWTGLHVDRPDRLAADWLEESVWDAGDLVRATPSGERTLAARLRLHGLPETPATMRHLRAVAAGRASPLPARGVLVTTLVFASDVELVGDRDGALKLLLDFDANPDISITGALELATGPLFEQVGTVALAHRNWLRRYGRSWLTVPANVRRAQPGSMRPGTAGRDDRFDYLAEAMRDADALAAAARHRPANLEGKISAYLARISRRVNQRRRRAGVRTRAEDKGWTGKARILLRRRLRDALR